MVRTAREVDFFTNLTAGSWWVRLNLTVLGTTLPVPLLRSTPNDSVTFVFSDAADERWGETVEFEDRSLAAAVSGFAQQLG